MLCVGYIDPTHRSYLPYTLDLYVQYARYIWLTGLQVADKQHYFTRLFALSNATLIFGQIFSFPSSS